jgi:hypothetical protein
MRSTVVQARSAYADEATIDALWRAICGREIGDELLEWPADLLALTYLILERSEAYRFVLSPPAGAVWPPEGEPGWAEAVKAAGVEWCARLEDDTVGLPSLVDEEWRVLRAGAITPLVQLGDGCDWRLCQAVLTLHAIADEACAGLGVALDTSIGSGCVYRARGREFLARTGSLSRVPSHCLRVLPKVRTPAGGTSLSSLARYACVLHPGVEARWHKVPTRRLGTDPRASHVNFLLLPWPLRVRESDFRVVADSVQQRANEPFGFFEFAPSQSLDFELLDRVLVAARDEVDSIDAVVFPESAVDQSEVDGLEALLEHHGVGFLSTGVRLRPEHAGRLPRNGVHISINPNLEKGRRTPSATGEQWFHICQRKHHRWSLDEAQIDQYHLGGALHPHVRWWEAMDVPRRVIQFVETGTGPTVVFLVCEDLAQNDDVAEVMRSVGPTIVMTPLLDGPQLTSRWAARYASVLADDPGSAVLTLTSYGMVQRSRPRGHESSSIIALWKDPTRGTREISLDPGAHAVLLAACEDTASRRSTDGRAPIANSCHFFDVGVQQIRAAPTGSGPPSAWTRTPRPRALEVDELTILTGWAEALAEALAVAPDRVDDILATATDNENWRAELGISEPSIQLRDTIRAMGHILAGVPRDTDTRMQLALAAVHNAPPNELGRERLARRTLRSMLEARLSRQMRTAMTQ